MLKESYEDAIARKERHRREERKKIKEESDSLNQLKGLQISPITEKKK